MFEVLDIALCNFDIDDSSCVVSIFLRLPSRSVCSFYYETNSMKLIFFKKSHWLVLFIVNKSAFFHFVLFFVLILKRDTGKQLLGCWN